MKFSFAVEENGVTKQLLKCRAGEDPYGRWVVTSIVDSATGKNVYNQLDSELLAEIQLDAEDRKMEIEEWAWTQEDV